MEEYQVIPGHRIYFTKSELVFSNNVSREFRETFLSEIGIQQVSVHSTYLGLHLSFGHNKSEMLKFLVERTLHKVMGWKEVLIKSVLCVIPQYVMMCFEVPRSICKKGLLVQSLISGGH